jgi:hypothetical protein
MRDNLNTWRAGGLLLAVLWAQGAYYFLTGLWPLVSIETFQLVTGPKTDHLVTGREGDHWLVMTVAALVVAVSLPLLLAAWLRRATPEAAAIPSAAALALTAIDVIYVAREVIPPIYLADAAAELLLLAGWAAGLWARSRGN